ncbi:MAG: LytTR family DNA-binding domain-containing protein [Bacillota bacterium]
MINIAICEDEKKSAKEISTLLSEYKNEHLSFEYEVSVFVSGEDLQTAIAEGELFDLILLDIYMGEKSGDVIAKELRDKDFSGQIIFVSSSKEHIFTAFAVDAVQYLVKPIDRSQFYSAVDKAIERVEITKPSFIILSNQDVTKQVSIYDITHVETSLHYQNVHLKTGESIIVRMTFGEMCDMLLHSKNFIALGKTCIINYQHVRVVTGKTITMSTRKSTFIPRGYYRKVKDGYFAYYKEN